MAEWVKFDGSKEQLRVLKDAKYGWLFRFKDNSVLEFGGCFEHLNLSLHEIKEFLVCDPHPHIRMIAEWARTGRPVYVLVKDQWLLDEYPKWGKSFIYSFDPPKKKFKYRTALFVSPSNNHYLTYAREEYEISKTQGRPGFVRWLTDWQEVEV